MISLSKPKPSLKLIKAIRGWVEDALPPEKEDVTVMVNELQCYEPGCAPLETVVSLLDPGKPIMFKLFAPVREVANSPDGREQVVAALQKALAGVAQPEHLQSPSPPQPADTLGSIAGARETVVPSGASSP